ncbi:hypothetical protein NST06_10840 [Bacillus sp. FSL P4-0322]|uniref:hypothetical protein n=1 Tax=Bacillus sp. FSL P4-0322 TaxID=2954583 RepID=UPI0030DDC21A
MLDSNIKGLFKKIEYQLANLKGLFTKNEKQMLDSIKVFKEENDQFKEDQTFLLNDHINNNENPHNVTKEQIGLSNVLNKEQATKEEFSEHLNNHEIHVTQSQKDEWSIKETVDGSQEKADKALDDATKLLSLHKNELGIHTSLEEKQHWNGYSNLINELDQTLQNSQLYRITTANGYATQIQNSVDIFTLKTGVYFGKSLVNSPISTDEDIFVIVFEKDENTKSINVVRLNDGEMWTSATQNQNNSEWVKAISLNDYKRKWTNTTLINGAVTNPLYPLKHSFNSLMNSLDIQGTFTASVGTTIAALSYYPSQNIDFTGATIGSIGIARMTLKTNGELVYTGLNSSDNTKVERISLNENIKLT